VGLFRLIPVAGFRRQGGEVGSRSGLTSGDKVHFRCGAHTFCPKEVKLGDNFRAIMTWGANMSVIMRNGTKQKLIDAGAAVKPCDFESMSADKLWTLHEKITATLAKK
jgi:hypothetical protein